MRHFYSAKERAKASDLLMQVVKSIPAEDRRVLVDYLDIVQADNIFRCVELDMTNPVDTHAHAGFKQRAALAYELSVIFDNPDVLKVNTPEEKESEEY